MTTSRDQFQPSPDKVATIHKDGATWTLVVVKSLRHSREQVWQALTDPVQLREWAPFDADGNLAVTGAAVKLTTVGAPSLHVTDTKVTRADAPSVLEYNWGGFDMRWQLEAADGGTRLTLWTSIDRRYIAMGAAGWHLCFDVLDRFLAGAPVGRLVGPDAAKFGGWQRLHAEYAKEFNAAAPTKSSSPTDRTRS